jgi:hypothetical protein
VKTRVLRFAPFATLCLLIDVVSSPVRKRQANRGNEREDTMSDARLTMAHMYKAAQNPTSWLLSAEQLRDAAEVIINAEVAREMPYFRAYDEAAQDALSIACTGTNESGHAEIKSDPPNYPPAQLLYAYAMENVLKGLIVANDTSVVNENKISKRLQSHDLVELSARAGVTVHAEERPVLIALSDLSVWAARYPVATRKEDYIGKENPHAMLDYGSRHAIMRRFFDRVNAELKGKLPRAPSRHDVVVVFRPLGT